VADGVFLRCGTDPANLNAAVEQIRAGERDAGRPAGSVRLGLVLHTVLDDDAERALLMGKSMAAGFYEYSPYLFDHAGLRWEGPNIHELQNQVFPDFHHHADLVESGRIVDFLPEAAADAFCLHGGAPEIAAQLKRVLSQGIEFEIVVLHPVPNPPQPGAAVGVTYMERVAREVIGAVR
jgi:alkanesulfonate monooxygenase SsuD/methylene tetrahydromethanopterin reductase-like flavin-dependent oxidoreductase (luciferase family)